MSLRIGFGSEWLSDETLADHKVPICLRDNSAGDHPVASERPMRKLHGLETGLDSGIEARSKTGPLTVFIGSFPTRQRSSSAILLDPRNNDPTRPVNWQISFLSIVGVRAKIGD